MCLPEGMEAWAILRGNLNCKKPMSLGNRSNKLKKGNAYYENLYICDVEQVYGNEAEEALFAWNG